MTCMASRVQCVTSVYALEPTVKASSEHAARVQGDFRSRRASRAPARPGNADVSSRAHP